MTHEVARYKEWLEHDGKTVYLGGVAYVVKVNTWRAQYPYEVDVIAVHAEMKNKNSALYRDVKRSLGDDWSTDVLDSDEQVYVDVLSQCRNVGSL